jgi:hypothetical protein
MCLRCGLLKTKECADERKHRQATSKQEPSPARGSGTGTICPTEWKNSGGCRIRSHSESPF